MSGSPLRVLYLLRAFPKLSETFILGEIQALRRRGIAVQIVALERPSERAVHPDAVDLLSRVTWVPRAIVRGNPRPGGIRRNRPLPRGLPERDHAFWRAGEWVADRLGPAPPDHIHAHFAGPAATMAAAVSRSQGVPFTFTAHAKDIFHRKVDWIWLQELGRQASAVVAVSGYSARHLRRRLPEGRVVRIHNGVDLEAWRPDARRQRGRLVLAVGRLVPKKGFDVLLEALAKLSAKGIQLRAVIVGEGAERDRLRAQARALGLSSRVRMPGAMIQPAVQRLMRRAAVVVLPSVIAGDGNRDALPTVLLEAGAGGVPVIASRVAGIPEIVRHRETGLLVPPGDPAALALALERLLTRPSLRARLGRAARRRIERYFDQRRAAVALERMFRKLARTARRQSLEETHAARVAMS